MPTHIDPNRYLDPIAYANDPVDESQRAWAKAYAELDTALTAVGSEGTLYVVCGLSGAGKTTWVQHHLNAFGDKAVFFDVAVPATQHRHKTLQIAHKNQVPAIAVWIEITPQLALERNQALPEDKRVPESTVRHAFALFQHPSTKEGFAEVRIVNANDSLK